MNREKESFLIFLLYFFIINMNNISFFFYIIYMMLRLIINCLIKCLIYINLKLEEGTELIS